MDALARLLGEEREELGEGVYLRAAPASAYLRAYAARLKAGDDDQSGTLMFVAELLAGGLCGDDGLRLFEHGDAAVDRLPVDFIMKHTDAVFRINGLDTEASEEDADKPDEGNPTRP